jgi:glycosyltransferase involved in cell wall biosynthesis
MKICLLGEYSGNLDEGMRKVSYHLAKELLKCHRMLILDLRSVFRRSFLRSIRLFNPQIIHYIHGGSPRSFMILNFISRYCPSAKTVISIMRFNPFSLYTLSLFKPDLILAQSSETEGKFRSLGCNTKFLPCIGVDLEKHMPIQTSDKSRLRKKYGIDEDKFVILHVGSIKSGRNVQFLNRFQKGKNQVIIVGSTSTGIDRRIHRSLEKSGCVVLAQYFEHIEEIYALSDCYVFPTILKKDFLGRPIADCIDAPLSVLEAMAHNLPVITTRFGALPRMFKEGDGLFFVEREKDFFDALNEIKSGVNPKTREKVMPYSWANLRKKMEEAYSTLVSENES